MIPVKKDSPKRGEVNHIVVINSLYISKLKEQFHDHITDEGNLFDKNIFPFMTQLLAKLRRGKNLLNLIKCI